MQMKPAAVRTRTYALLRNAAHREGPPLGVTELDAHSEETREQLARIGEAQVVLGIPTFNNRETVERVAEASLAALAKQLTPQRTVIVNADGASKDGTPEHLRAVIGDKAPLVQIRYPVYPVRRLSAPLAGVPGRQEAASAIFALSKQLGAGVCTVFDADLESVTADWIDRLVSPVLDDGMDMVVPCYQRHKFDGMINSAIVSPFLRALYGKRLRQPAGADLSFSARLVDFFAGQESSNGNAPTFVDPWDTVPVIANGFRIGQSFLGPRVVHPHEVSPDVSDTLRQVLTTVFDPLERTAPFWQRVRSSEEVPWFGPPLEINTEHTEINRKRMIDSFRLGCQDLEGIWNLILPPATLLDLRRMQRLSDAEFCFHDDVWARTVYDFALGYHQRVIGRDHLLQALTPLYWGWVASFIKDMQDAGAEEVDERLERLSKQFEMQKRYLISRWRWPDRFSP